MIHNEMIEHIKYHLADQFRNEIDFEELESNFPMSYKILWHIAQVRHLFGKGA